MNKSVRRWLVPGLLSILPILFPGCGDGDKPAAEDSSPYPSIPDSTMQRLWEECDYIDWVYYDLSFSMSQDQRNDIQQSILHVSPEVPKIDPACRPIGRVFFQIEGENVAQADIFFSPQCQYFIFYEGDEKTYANAMTPAGIAFYERVMSIPNQR